MNPTLFITALRSEEYPAMPAFAIHAGLCALQHSGCVNVLLTDYGQSGWEDVNPYMVETAVLQSHFAQAVGRIPKEAYSISRWLIIRDYCAKHRIQAPVISVDWDYLVFEKLWPHFQACGVEQSDYGASYDRERSQSWTSPHIVMQRDKVDRFAELALAQNWEGFNGGGDMVLWEKLRIQHEWQAVSVNEEVNGCLFDSNILLDADRYEHDGMGKIVVLKDGKPHFVRKDGALVKAVAVHCFMDWKQRTGELV